MLSEESFAKVLWAHRYYDLKASKEAEDMLRRDRADLLADARAVTLHLMHMLRRTKGYCRDCEAAGWTSCEAHDEAVLARARAHGWDRAAEAQEAGQ